MVSDELHQLKGIVIAIKANYYIVEIDFHQFHSFSSNKVNFNKNQRFLCTLRKRLIHRGFSVYVGDNVEIESVDSNTHRAVICGIEPRKSFFKRPPVANITEVYVLLSIQKPSFDFEQASRFLLTAEHSGLQVSLILTKSDLTNNDDLIHKVKRLRNWGYYPISISVRSGKGVEAFINKIRLSKLAVLCGPSGVGKSSLLNCLLPDESILIGDLSGKLQRGRNTTRNVQLYSLKEGVFIADTPGFNRPDLQVSPIELQTLFPEIRSQLANSSCKFRDCLHQDEPGCGIDKNWERYVQYRKLLNEMINFLD